MAKKPFLLLILFMSSTLLVYGRAETYARHVEANYVSKKETLQYQSLSVALINLEKTYKASIMFDSKRAENIKVKIENNNNTDDLEKTLTKLLAPVNLNYKKISDKFYVINFDEKKTQNKISTPTVIPNVNLLKEEVKVNTLAPVDITVTGVVTDGSNGEVLPGVTIKVKGSIITSSTDEKGKFTIKFPEKGTLVFSYISFITKEVVIESSRTLNITLMPDQQKLNEVVIVGVGYGTQQKKNLTGSIASISANSIKDIPVMSFENAIQGQIAGVQVQEPSGEPGAATTIRVRGIGSISAGNEPLYVVDGFPVSKNVESATQGDVSKRTVAFKPAPSNPLGTISPGDIQSVEVLKDAAAAAIYGSRGSNGVIIITTKKGRRDGTSSINFDSYYGVQTLANKVDLMNSAELADYVLDAKNNAYIQDFPTASKNDPNSVRYARSTNTSYYLPVAFTNPTGVDTDWQDVLFKSASIQSYNLSLSGGNEKLGYYVSGNYYNQGGIIDATGFKRYSFRVNIESNPVKNLKIGANLNPSFTNQAKGSTSAPYFANPPGAVYTALVTSPTVSPYLPNGQINQSNNQSHIFTEDGRGTNMTASSNPLAVVKYIHDDLAQFRSFANAYAEYSILDGLKYKLMVGTDVNQYNRKYYREKAFLDRDATVGDPYAQSNSSLETNWLVENTLAYNKVFGSHSISAVAGYTAQKDKIRNNQVQADKFPDDLVQTVSGGQIAGGNATEEEWSLISYLGRVNYAFMDRYLFTATIRSDRASRFGEGNKVGIFPSFSAGWRISDEAFMKSLTFVNDLKLRASWGKTGNFLIPNYASIGLLNPYNYVFGNGVTNGIAPSTPSNPNLTWEKNTQSDIGLDMSFLKNRIFASVDLYRKVTSDLLLNVQVPAAIGFGSANPLQNIGEVENKGFEISLTTQNIVNKFTWTTDINYSANKNNVLKLGPSGDAILSAGGAGIRHITRIGDPIGSYYGYVVEGVYQTQDEINKAPKDLIAKVQSPGDFRFKDVNNDGKIDAADRTVIGNYQPKYTFGITNKFTYNKMELSFLIQGVEGAKVLNLTRRHLGNGEANVNSYAFENNRWRSVDQPGDGKTPRADRLGDTHGFNNRPSSYQVEDASYLRLRNVTFAYTLPEKVAGKYFSSIRLYASGTNLFTKTNYVGYNPEVNNQSTVSGVQGEDYGAYPLSRNFTFGINASFK